jgi:tRNA pseudouridine38-40 synthase
VQQEVERALAILTATPTAVVASGRTDAGVHALGLVCSFRTPSELDARRLGRALDALLPEDVGVVECSEAAPGFHARKDAAWKWYRYTILRAPSKRPLLARTTWRMAGPLDERLLEEAAAVVVGRQDVRAFGSAGSTRRSTVRTIFAARWTRAGDLLRFDVVGDGFLYKMVRTLVGTLVLHARRGEGADAMRRVLESRDRRAAGACAPARGLCLMAVRVRSEPAPASLPPDLLAAVESGAAATSEPPSPDGSRA